MYVRVTVLYVLRVTSINMDDLEAALLVNVYFVLVQALLESTPSYEAPESVMVEFASVDTTASPCPNRLVGDNAPQIPSKTRSYLLG
jgi:hypothetical protein